MPLFINDLGCYNYTYTAPDMQVKNSSFMILTTLQNKQDPYPGMLSYTSK